MKFTISALMVLSLAGASFSRTDTISADEIKMSALSEISDGHLRTLEGEVKIETSNVSVRADKAVVNIETLDVEATGNVHITLKK